MVQKHIIIVEDDDGIQDMLTFVLSSSDQKITICSDAHAYLDQLKREVPDLILMDINLPDGNGIDLCHYTRDLPDFTSVPLILMSANTYRNAAEECGADAFIGKPFNIHELKAIIASFLNVVRSSSM